MFNFNKKKKPEEKTSKETEMKPHHHSTVHLEKKYHEAMISGLSADIERLKAQSEANNELRQMFSEKFSRIDEQVGELRSMLVERERDMQSLEVTATKASDLVAEVKPEKLIMETQKLDAKFESLKSQIETHSQINETLMEELKQVRETVKTFRGIKEIEKTNRELHDDQTIMKKIEAKIEQHSDKVESIYMDLNKKYEDFRMNKENSCNFEQALSSILKELDALKIANSNVMSKESYFKIEEKVNNLLNKVNIKLQAIGVVEKEVLNNKDKIEKLKAAISESGKFVRETLLDLEIRSAKLAPMSELNKMDAAIKKLGKEMLDSQKQNERSIKSLSREKEKLSMQLSKLKDKIKK